MQNLILTRIALLVICCPLVCMAGIPAESDEGDNRSPSSFLRPNGYSPSVNGSPSEDSGDSDFEIISEETVQTIVAESQANESSFGRIGGLLTAVTNGMALVTDGMAMVLDYAYTSGSDPVTITSEQEEESRERCRRLRKEQERKERQQEFLRRQKEKLDEVSKLIEEERTNPHALFNWNIRRFSTLAATTQWDSDDDSDDGVESVLSARRAQLVQRGDALIKERRVLLTKGIQPLGGLVANDDVATPMTSSELTPPPPPPPAPPPPLPVRTVADIGPAVSSREHRSVAACTKHPERPDREDLFDAIRKGVTLKKIPGKSKETSVESKETSGDSAPLPKSAPDLASVMKAALEKKFHQSSSSSEVSSDDEDWGDE